MKIQLYQTAADILMIETYLNTSFQGLFVKACQALNRTLLFPDLAKKWI